MTAPRCPVETRALLLRKSVDVERARSGADRVGHERVPAIEQVELDRAPVGRFQRSSSAINGTASTGKSNGPMCMMYSSTTSFSSSTIMMLRAVWNTRSSSHSGFSYARMPATRLCSRRKTMFITRVADRRVTVLEPDGEERVRLLFGGAAQDHASDERLIEEPSNSGLKVACSPSRRGANRNCGYSSPSISWLLSRPPSNERSRFCRFDVPAVDLAQVDLMVGFVLAVVGHGWSAGSCR